MVWLQLEFPWIGYGFISAVAETHGDEFERDLRRLGFTVVTVNCGTTERELFEGFRLSLRLADYCHPGWDSLNDCLRDFEWPARFALVLRNADRLATADPKTFGEACAFIFRLFEERNSAQSQSILVLTGQGHAFHSPDDPSPDRALDEERNMPVAIERRRRTQESSSGSL